jgi:hypothetical protein
MWVSMSKPMIRPDDRACLPLHHPPIPAAAQRLDAPAALVPEQYRDLLDYLAQITDPRHRRGRRYALATVLAVAVAAVLAGARSLAAIGEWASDAPGQVLAHIGAWLAARQLPPANPSPSARAPRRAVAVDGKTVRLRHGRTW